MNNHHSHVKKNSGQILLSAVPIVLCRQYRYVLWHGPGGAAPRLAWTMDEGGEGGGVVHKHPPPPTSFSIRNIAPVLLHMVKSTCWWLG